MGVGGTLGVGDEVRVGTRVAVFVAVGEGVSVAVAGTKGEDVTVCVLCAEIITWCGTGVMVAPFAADLLQAKATANNSSRTRITGE